MAVWGQRPKENDDDDRNPDDMGEQAVSHFGRDAEDAIIRLIHDQTNTRSDIVPEYARILGDQFKLPPGDRVDWVRINKAIRARWQASSLWWIVKEARKIGAERGGAK